jgi:hypothetical protein
MGEVFAMGKPKIEVVWLQELPQRLQERYFEMRRRSYSDIWGRRGVPIAHGFGLRDEFDDDAVVAAVRNDDIIGGVRANIVRPMSAATNGSPKLPMETHWKVDPRGVFPDHDFETRAYAEASRLFLCGDDNWLQGAMLKVRLLDFLLKNVPDVAVTYFVLPATLLRSYRLLAQQKRIPHEFRAVEGLRPNSSATGGKPTQWGIFACKHAA